MYKKNYLTLLIVLLTLLAPFNNLVANSVTATYTSGHIPTNRGWYSSSCNGPSTTLSVTIPPGAFVTGIDVEYDMSSYAQSTTRQRSAIHCQETGNTESYATSPFSLWGGVVNYSRNNVSIANGVSPTGILTFEMRAYRYRAITTASCGEYYCRVDNNTWSITVNYIIISSPGNVSTSNLNLWLKADAQTNCTTNNCKVTDWKDNTINTNNATQNLTTNQPTYVTSGNNYNPGILFDQSNQHFLSIPDNNTLDLGNNHSIFIVSELEEAVDGYISPLSKHNASFSNGGYGFHGFYSDILPFDPLNLKTTYASNVDVNSLSSDAASIDAVIDGTPNMILGQYNGSQVSLSKNSGNKSSTSFSSPMVNNNSPLVIGSDHDNLTVSSHFDGKINEVIIFDRALTPLEERKIESYLGIKYSITLDNTLGGTAGDYISSSGKILWDASVNASYHKDIIAIGRDDNGALSQKQSKTNDDSTKVYISSLASSNQLNTGSITNDDSYIVIGNNKEDLNADITNTQEAPTSVYSRILREWKITNNNFVDEFTIEIKLNSSVGNINLSDIIVLADTDGDFTNASIISSPSISISAGTVIISGIGTSEIPLNSTRYITLASVNENTPLPVELNSFDVANVNNEYSKVNWSTLSEIDNAYFIVEKSTNTIEWEKVNRIEGANNSNQLISYESIDKNPHLGLSYYRLKQVDNNGDYNYSPIRSVIFKKEDKVLIYPNPTNGLVTIKTANSANKKLEIYNIIGQNISDQILINRTNDDIKIDLEHLNSGNYIIIIEEKSYKISLTH